MKVTPALIEASLNEPEKAIRMINVFSRATLAAPPSALGPGTWVYGASTALNRRVLRANPKVNVFHRGFVACDQYANGINAIAAPVFRNGEELAGMLTLVGTLQDIPSPPPARLIDLIRGAAGLLSDTLGGTPYRARGLVPPKALLPV